MKSLFVTFEGTEGSGKSTQIKLLADRLRRTNHRVQVLREPGGTPIGEEIRHTLQHSTANHEMTPEAELLLLNASRAQLVRQVIRPALLAGDTVLCDRFYDSTTAYQGFGRCLPADIVKTVIDFAVGDTRPDLTLFFQVSGEISNARLASRQATMPFVRDRMEEADRAFYERALAGYLAIAAIEPERVRVVDAAAPLETIHEVVWCHVQSRLGQFG